jgi:hypothetical protein
MIVTRRRFLAGLGATGALLAAPVVIRIAPAAAQTSRIDWCFACTGGKAQFLVDFRQFCQDAGYVVSGVVDPDGKARALLVDQAANLSLSMPSMRIFPDLRIDLDVIDNLVGQPAVVSALGVVTTPAVLRGFHLNVRSSPMSPAAASAAATLDAALRAWFATKPLVVHDTPASMLTAFGVTAKSYRTTTGGTKLIDPLPLVRKRVYA